MLEEIPQLLEFMKSDTESTPDIQATSSNVIISILREHFPEDLPIYARALSLEDYFSERVTGSFAIKTIKNAWRTSRDSFEISVWNNELRYNAGNTWDVDRILKELPETPEAHKSRDWLVMDLETAKELFGIDFKLPFWKTIFN